MALALTINFGEHKGHGYVDDSFVVKTQEEFDRMTENCYKLFVKSELQKYQQSGISQRKKSDEH